MTPIHADCVIYKFDPHQLDLRTFGAGRLGNFFPSRAKLAEFADHGDAALDVGEVEADHVVEVHPLAPDDDDGARHLLVEPEPVAPGRRRHTSKSIRIQHEIKFTYVAQASQSKDEIF